jgi:hypothetical protein
MPRSLAAPLLVLLVASAPLSAQSDTTPSPAGDVAAPTSTAPAFRAGQWGARFDLGSGGFYGIGALLFTSPSAAWTMTLGLSASYSESGDDYTSEARSVSLGVGRRWYGAGHSRVRPIGGVGLSANYSQSEYENPGGSSSNSNYGGSVYGELGAAIFFAPELSLGATWRAGVGGAHSESSNSTSYGLSAGHIALEGAFYF